MESSSPELLLQNDTLFPTLQPRSSPLDRGSKSLPSSPIQLQKSPDIIRDSKITNHVPPSNKSFTEIVAGKIPSNSPKTPTIFSECQLTDIGKVINADDKVILQFSAEESATLARKWELALIGKFTQGIPELKIVRQLISDLKLKGHPLKIDPQTAVLSRLSVARLCVGVDVSKPKKEQILIQIDSELREQRVVFESFPKFCTGCFHLGHEVDACYIVGNAPRPPRKESNRAENEQSTPHTPKSNPTSPAHISIHRSSYTNRLPHTNSPPIRDSAWVEKAGKAIKSDHPHRGAPISKDPQDAESAHTAHFYEDDQEETMASKQLVLHKRGVSTSPKHLKKGPDKTPRPAKSTRSERHHLWDELRTTASSLNNDPWLVGGDFNCFLSESERQGSNTNRHLDIEDFGQMVSDCGLIDAGFIKGPIHTWVRNSLKERLDRIFINTEWGDLFRKSDVSHLARVKSDRAPLLFHGYTSLQRTPSSFRFLKMWTRHHNFLDVVKEAWSGPTWVHGMLNLHFKLIRTKQKLQWWNRHIFGNIFDKLHAAENTVSEAENRYDSDPSPNNRIVLNKAIAELVLATKIEEDFWHQKSSCFPVSHLAYADDIIIFSNDSSSSLTQS
ncbi:hypothetical protein DH2020_027716 [Rehmannia glutinosa]|uniref:Endonuclease/exonuclease/phosphatase domain-containing protein n=1 Tax=Rehmannia glutinosa TaxID=99300 RepID=A0ABR0VUB4_REHGL